MQIHDILKLAPVVPVLVIENADDAVPLARALVAGGLPAIEVTLRSAAALTAIQCIAQEVEGAVVGAGTVTSVADLEAVAEAGGRFAVSPGLTPALLDAAPKFAHLPLLPGVMTPSEAMRARDAGFTTLKLFPAQAAGGIAFLKALSGPFPDLTFCPTGGIKAETFRAFLALANVACVGGSWVAPKAAIQAKDWSRITRLAMETNP